MDEMKRIISKNISELRQSQKMTQAELAEFLNYSDKAVSKWERGESVPDISVLKKIADRFGVTLDYLVEEVHPLPEPPAEAAAEPEVPAGGKSPAARFREHAMITAISVLLVWLVATLGYFLADMVSGHVVECSLAFVYAVPVSMIVWLVFNSIWFNRRWNYLIISLLMWSILASVYVSILPFAVNIWRIFLLGIPGQIIIGLWSRIRVKPREKQPADSK